MFLYFLDTVKCCEEKLNEIVAQSSSESCQNDEYLRLINYEEISERDENEKYKYI